MILATLIFVTGCGATRTAAGTNAAPPPMEVSFVEARTGEVTLRNEWIGTLDGYVNAQIQPQVSGYLVEQKYREGQVISKGQVLFQIDRRPFQAVLDQAKGQIGQAEGQTAQAEGQLAQAEAAQKLTQINVDRDTPLAAQRAIAQSQLDNEKQQLAQAEASVKAVKGTIAAAQAAIVSAKANAEAAALNLDFTEVRSLISGVAGQAAVQPGNLVGPQSVLTSVSQLDPIKVYFSISDEEYLGLSKKTAGPDLLSANVPLTLTLSDGSVFPHKGRIVFVDRQMNQQTGAIRIAATFDNPGNVLRPGQFGRVSATTHVIKDALLVPQPAVMDLQGQKQVYTVSADGKVHVVNVTVGSEQGKDWVINSGITPGTRVITNNLQKLREGMPVSAKPASPATSSRAASSATSGAGN
jgi:membrane fusion protein (multidrug efflux system)